MPYKRLSALILIICLLFATGCTPENGSVIFTLPPEETLPPLTGELTPSDISDEAMEKRILKRFLDIHPDSRPGDKLEAVEYIAVHYVANPSTTAEQNRRYFNSHPGASAHFIIGLEGEILQCIPLDEVAWSLGATKTPPRGNRLSISIECCHPDETGEFTEATYRSLRALVSWLCRRFDLGPDAVRRHSDFYMPAPPKKCPLYFVEHPEKWEQFLSELLIEESN